MILFRTQKFRPVDRRFAEELACCSGHQLVCVVDERSACVDVSGFPKVSLTLDACNALGLYCPKDVGWRCGDYGYYLARKQYPDEHFFWMIEYDVRFAGNPEHFFKMYKNDTSTDLLAPDLRRADTTWFWEHAIASRSAVIHRCLFPLVRLSVRAIDHLAAKRVEMARRLARRLAWPNDESFVATVLSNSPGMICRDLNDFGYQLYDSQTFSYYLPFNGDELHLNDDRLKIYHPVLFGADYEAKLERLKHHDIDHRLADRIMRRLAREVNSRMPL